jgi:deoxyribonuclease IV
MLILGHHIFLKQGYVSTVDWAKKTGANIFQIFLKSPQNFKYKMPPKEDSEKLGKIAKTNNILIVIHGSYMLNLCHPDKAYIRTMALQSLIDDMEHCSYMGAIGVILHMGKNIPKLKLTEKQARLNYVNGVKYILSKTPKNSNIILETGAGVGSEICSYISDLGQLIKMFTCKERKRIKVCIDTCHVFACGYYISDPKMVNIFINEIEIHIGWKNIICVHLNDSKNDCFTKKDCHDNLGNGKIKLKGLLTFMKYCEKIKIPLVLETPNGAGDKKKEMNEIRQCYENFCKE